MKKIYRLDFGNGTPQEAFISSKYFYIRFINSFFYQFNQLKS